MYVPTGIHRVQLSKNANLEVSLVPQSLVPTKAQFFLNVVAPTLLPFMLESKKGVTVYNPQRVMHQFGYDQGTVVLTGELSLSSASDTVAGFTGMV